MAQCVRLATPVTLHFTQGCHSSFELARSFEACKLVIKWEASGFKPPPKHRSLGERYKLLAVQFISSIFCFVFAFICGEGRFHFLCCLEVD